MAFSSRGYGQLGLLRFLTGLYVWFIFGLTFIFQSSVGQEYDNGPLRCEKSSVGNSCQAYLDFHLYATESPEEFAGHLFEDQWHERALYVNETDNALFVRVNCSCTEDNVFIGHTSFSTGSNSTSSASIVDRYRGLAWMPKGGNYQENTKVDVSLSCRCSEDNGYWQYLSYLAQVNDDVDSIVAQYDSNLTLFLAANNLSSEKVIVYTDKLYYVPVRQVYGDILEPSKMTPDVGKRQENKTYKVLTVVGITCAVLLLIIAITIVLITRVRFQWKPRIPTISYKKSVPKLIPKHTQCSHNSNTTNDIQTSISKETSNMLDPEKVISFKFEEIVKGTSSFSEKNFVGHSWYGSSYIGYVRGEQYDIKKVQLGPRKLTAEFFRILRNLHMVHHANLASLIGYASHEEEVVLIYESSECGPLSDRLHDPVSKGLAPLTWVGRLQIAQDVARGLEYVHDHTYVHYVHCGINTSTILLEQHIQGKVAEFGLSTLLQTIESGYCVTKDITKLAFIAPEFLDQGSGTSKSDVYSFGVVLFELLTGQKATTESYSSPQSNIAVAPVTLRAFKETPRPFPICQLRHWVDPNLCNVYEDDLFRKTAEIAQGCLERDPALRPNMSEIVFNLSHILLESIEWDATLAGGSQVFSGLEYGR